MDDLVYLGKYIKLQRERLNLNISQLAYKSHYSRSYLSQIESGRVLPSAKLEETIDNIFTCLNMNYQDYVNTNISLEKDINELFDYIFFNLREQRDALYHKLNESENKIISCKAFPRYCLSKFVYNVLLNNTINNGIDELKKSLVDNINIFDLKDKSITYMAVGVYFRNKANCEKSEFYLLKALEFGEFKDVSGLIYYQLAATQSLKNRLVAAYINIQKSIFKFNSEGNFKRLIYSQAQEAVILGRCKEYSKAEKILKEILNNYKLTDDFKIALFINLAQIYIGLKKYKEAIKILDNLNIINDNIIFMRLYAYYKLSDKNNFNSYYAVNKLNTILFEQRVKILYMKMNNKHKSDEYNRLLLDSLKNNELKYDVDSELFILDELIEYYESIGKYKFSNQYLKKKLKLLEV